MTVRMSALMWQANQRAIERRKRQEKGPEMHFKARTEAAKKRKRKAPKKPA